MKLAAFDKAITDSTAVLSTKADNASALDGRGIAKLRSGNQSGGDSDPARAKAMQADIMQVLAGFGVQEVMIRLHVFHHMADRQAFG